MLYINMLMCKYLNFTLRDIDDMDWVMYRYYIDKLEEEIKNMKDMYKV